MTSNPALYGQLFMALNGQNVNAASANGSETINFGGQQYTPAQYYQLMQQHPELFKTQTAQQIADAANAPFFAANAAQTKANQAANQSTVQQGQQAAQKAQQLQQAVTQFQQQYGPGIQQPGSPGYSVPDPRFTDPNTGHMYSQAERDQASAAWSAANANRGTA